MEHALMKHVQFHGDLIPIIDKDGKRFVAAKPICTNIGLDWDSQQKFIQRDARLNSVKVIMEATGADGKTYKMLCVPLKYLMLWLAKINPGNYTGEVKDKLMRYQDECAEVLYQHKLGPRFRRPERPFQGDARRMCRQQQKTQTEPNAEVPDVWLTLKQVAILEDSARGTHERKIRRGEYDEALVRKVPAYSGRFATRTEIHLSALSPKAHKNYQRMMGSLSTQAAIGN